MRKIKGIGIIMAVILLAIIVVTGYSGVCDSLIQKNDKSGSSGGIGRWLPMSDSGVFPGRYLPTAIWTGSEMVIWGGRIYNNGLISTDGGAKYNLVNNLWTSTISMLDAPCARGQYASVWTGSEMVIWGGGAADCSTYLNTGARYNPSTNNWSVMTTTDAPSARSECSAVWTGSEMIIWGGHNAGDPFNPAGARYNPSLDKWTAMTTTNAPPTMSQCSAVWTGAGAESWRNKMIVWNGDGGIYDPVNNRWDVISTAGAPSGRNFSSAVWIGSKMIIWGGYDYSTSQYCNDGAIYDPSNNTWITITNIGAPSPRQTTAIWTGTKMIIWGGVNAVGYLNTGGVYDPVTNSWNPTATKNAPSPRDGHSAIWTGSKMVIWGGMTQYSNVGLVNTGGIYILE